MSRSTTQVEQYKRLRGYLSPAFSGKNTDAILNALAGSVAVPLVNLMEAIHDQLYICTASGTYLDDKLAEYGVSRPPTVGLSDELFRELGIAVINQKQIRSLILNILSIIFGQDTTNANVSCTNYEPYDLSNNDQLLVAFDGGSPIVITFTSGQFANIHAALAEEVADAITSSLRSQNLTGSAHLNNNGIGNFVTIQSDTKGPSSQVEILGGQVQNALQFPGLRTTTAAIGTTWTVTPTVDGGATYTWTGAGPNPSLDFVHVGDYVNIFDSVFDNNVSPGSNETNQGTFTVTNVAIDGSSFSVTNFLVSPIANVVQTMSDSILFYQPIKDTIASLLRFASVYQSQANLLEIIVPATSQIIRRNRQGAMFIHDNSDQGLLALGPYTYNQNQLFTLLHEQSPLLDVASSNTGQLLFVQSTEGFPDAEGYVMIDFGTTNQEGPIPYLNIPSSQSILLSPAYVMQKIHEVGATVNLVLKQNVIPATDGSDYQAFVTTVAAGREYGEELIESIVAAGLNIVFTVVYPGQTGLAKNEASWIWGETGVDAPGPTPIA